MIWLGIDTSNKPLSIAIVKDHTVLAEHRDTFGQTHSVAAMPAIVRLLEAANLTPADLNAIAVAEGPGSYTGIRIGMTLAKTLAWSLSIPVYPVSSLQVLAAPGKRFSGLTISLMDARRNHVFAGVYKGTEKLLEQHISFEELESFVTSYKLPLLWVGQDTAIYKSQIETINAESYFADGHENIPSAAALIQLASTMNPAEDIHQLTPSYMRITEAEANWMKAND